VVERAVQSGRGMRCCMMNLHLNLTLAGVMVAFCLLSQFAVRAFPHTACGPEIECRVNLKSFVAAQRDFELTHGRYGTTFDEIGFRPEGNSRYLYTMDATRLAATFVPTDERAWKVKWALIPARAEGDVPVGIGRGATAVCVGNVDRDEEVDVWSVSTVLRRSSSGEEIQAFVPWHDRIDRERNKTEREAGAW
jgi:hypothetical protein